MHTPRHIRKNSGFSTQDEHMVLLGLEALTEALYLRYATCSTYHCGLNSAWVSSHALASVIVSLVYAWKLEKSSLLCQITLVVTDSVDGLKWG